jgi:hypothetical protein
MNPRDFLSLHFLRFSQGIRFSITASGPHEGLEGKTPSEACGITVKGNNKWLTLIQNASKKS